MFSKDSFNKVVKSHDCMVKSLCLANLYNDEKQPKFSPADKFLDLLYRKLYSENTRIEAKI